MTLMECLLHLNQVDAQVRGLRSRLESAQRYLDAQTRQRDELNSAVSELQTRRKHVRASIANLETEMAGIDERIEKLRNELNSAETNKQYTAILTELNTVKVRRADVEDHVLQEMESVESLDAQHEQARGQVTEREKIRGIAEQQLAERRSEIGERLGELEAERAQAAAAVPSDVLQVFDEMAYIFDGEAMAEVNEINRRHREYACGACNIHLPFELVSKLMGGVQSVVRCASCQRILYMQDDLRGALAKK